MEAPSHVVFGLAGAVVADSVFHITGTQLIGQPLGNPHQVADVLLLKIIYFGCAALGALTPDIDNARSTIGRRAGFVSKGIQALAGHRTIFHSLFGLVMVGAFVWGAQYALGHALYNWGFVQAGEALGAGVATGGVIAAGRQVAFIAFLVGYLLHIIADGLTLGGVPLLWPNHYRFGFPPERRWRFRTGSRMEFVVVTAVAVTVIVLIYLGKLHI
ncbi:MAG: metal-dependent hydrolase [Ktedonobacterales bacterium]